MGSSCFVFERFTMSVFEIHLYDCAFAVHAVFGGTFRGPCTFSVHFKRTDGSPGFRYRIFEFNLDKRSTFVTIPPDITLTTIAISISYSNLCNLVHVYNIANFDVLVIGECSGFSNQTTKTSSSSWMVISVDGLIFSRRALINVSSFSRFRAVCSPGWKSLRRVITVLSSKITR